MKPDHTAEGLRYMAYDCEDLGVTLDCWLEVEPAQRGAREGGVQIEPDYPETWSLVHVYLPDSRIDISPIIYPGMFTAIEMDAFENTGEWP